MTGYIVNRKILLRIMLMHVLRHMKSAYRKKEKLQNTSASPICSPNTERYICR